MMHREKTRGKSMRSGQDEEVESKKANQFVRSKGTERPNRSLVANVVQLQMLLATLDG